MTQKDLDRVKRSVIRKYPITAGLALHNLKIELSTDVDTAAVVGVKDDKGVLKVKCMKVNPDFFDKLSFSERVFVLAHETLHIAFRHFARSVKKPVRDAERKYQEYCEKESDPAKREAMKRVYHERYQRMWNIATDACINALLRKDGFTFPTDVIDPATGKPMQFVDMKEGFTKSAEKIYDYLYQKQEEKDQQKEQKQEQEKQQTQSSGAPGGQIGGNTTPLDDIDVDSYKGFDDHDSWGGDDSKTEEETKKQSEPTESTEEPEDEEEIDEEEVMRREQSSKKSFPSLSESFGKISGTGLGEIKPFKPIISWKRLLVGQLEAISEVWGNRRTSRFNPNPRIEERTSEGKPNVEVILDVSGSISVDLLRGFLMQLYPIFEALYGEDEVSIKVGCFSTRFSGFQTIASKKDIATFSPSIGGGTDFELAATSFTKDPGRTITKIVFTDGKLGSPQKTRVPDIIWVVFGDVMDFTPVGGRIIRVSEKDYREMIKQNLVYEETEDLDHSKSI